LRRVTTPTTRSVSYVTSAGPEDIEITDDH
jgi:hypothetical protein